MSSTEQALPVLTGLDWEVEEEEVVEEEVEEALNSQTGSLASEVHPLYREQVYRREQK
jgi:hypothetical protein